jgi:hypothetical protein
MMRALKVTRSMMAATRRGSGNTVPHSGWQVGGDGDGGSFLSFGDLEQRFGAAGVELDAAGLVEEQEVEVAVAGHDPGELPVVGGFGELVDELGGGGVADAAALIAGGQPESDQRARVPLASPRERWAASQ